MQNPDVRFWHEADVRLAAPEGPLTGAFRTLASILRGHEHVNETRHDVEQKTKDVRVRKKHLGLSASKFPMSGASKRVTQLGALVTDARPGAQLRPLVARSWPGYRDTLRPVGRPPVA